MTDDELKQHVKDQVMTFVGRTDVEQVQEEMKQMLTKLIIENQERIPIIQQALEEGPENANT